MKGKEWKDQQERSANAEENSLHLFESLQTRSHRRAWMAKLSTLLCFMCHLELGEWVVIQWVDVNDPEFNWIVKWKDQI